MENILQLLMAFLGSMGFALFFNTERKLLFPTSFGGFLAWLVYLITLKNGMNPYLSGFIASIITSLFAEIMARIYKKPATIFIAISAIPLIPGSSLYYAVHYMLLQQTTRSLYYAKFTLLFAACMSAGIILVNIIFSRTIYQYHQIKK